MLHLVARSSALAWALGLTAMTISKLGLGLGPGSAPFDLAASLWIASGAAYAALALVVVSRGARARRADAPLFSRAGSR